MLAEIETDKAIVEMPSPATGTILKIMHKEGDTVKVGETLVVIGANMEKLGGISDPKKCSFSLTGLADLDCSMMENSNWDIGVKRY